MNSASCFKVAASQSVKQVMRRSKGLRSRCRLLKLKKIYFPGQRCWHWQCGVAIILRIRDLHSPPAHPFFVLFHSSSVDHFWDFKGMNSFGSLKATDFILPQFFLCSLHMHEHMNMPMRFGVVLWNIWTLFPHLRSCFTSPFFSPLFSPPPPILHG